MEGRKIGAGRSLAVSEAEFRSRAEDVICRTAAKDPLWGVLRGLIREKTLTLLLAAMVDAIGQEFFPEEDDEIEVFIDWFCREIDGGEEEHHEA